MVLNVYLTLVVNNYQAAPDLIVDDVTVDNPTPDMQTVVAWLDEYGEWVEVEGWQDGFNQYGFVSWAVTGADFGKGPFRWLVVQEDLISISDEFNLPSSKTLPVLVHINSP